MFGSVSQTQYNSVGALSDTVVQNTVKRWVKGNECRRPFLKRKAKCT